jgi:hypothetical protein
MVQTVKLVPSSSLDQLPELDADNRPFTLLRPCDFTGWKGVFDQVPNHHDLILERGDYRAWGKCVVNHANPSDRRRVIRFTDTAKPWDRINNEAVTDGFQFTSGAAYWAVHGLTIRGPDLATCYARRGAKHITFDSLLIEDVDTHGIQLAGNHCTVQNCVIRRASPNDAAAVLIRVDGDPPVGNRVLDNEICDCIDGVGVTWWDEPGGDPYMECRDLLVEGNDIYLTEGRYVHRPEPALPPNPNPPRVHATAENAIDIKAGPRTSTDPLKFVRNRIWGFRAPEPNSAQKSDGAAVTIHRGAQRILFDHNVIFDCPIAFHEVERDSGQAGLPIDPEQGEREVALQSNIVSFMHPYNPADLGAVLRTKLPFHLDENWFSHSGTLSALPKKSGTHDIFGNNVLHCDTPLGTADVDWNAGTNNRVLQADDMSDILIERCRWTDRVLVRLRNAVLSGAVF